MRVAAILDANTPLAHIAARYTTLLETWFLCYVSTLWLLKAKKRLASSPFDKIYISLQQSQKQRTRKHFADLLQKKLTLISIQLLMSSWLMTLILYHIQPCILETVFRKGDTPTESRSSTWKASIILNVSIILEPYCNFAIDHIRFTLEANKNDATSVILLTQVSYLLDSDIDLSRCTQLFFLVVLIKSYC